jgi:hypothetical protein
MADRLLWFYNYCIRRQRTANRLRAPPLDAENRALEFCFGIDMAYSPYWRIYRPFTLPILP